MEENNKSPEELNNEIKGYHSEIFHGNGEQKSIKEQIEKYHSSVSTSQIESAIKIEKINKFFSDLFEKSEVRNSIEEEISTFYRDLFEDSDDKDSIKSEINTLLDNAKNEYSDFSKKKVELSEFHTKTLQGDETNLSTQEKIDIFYDKLFTDKEDVESIQTQFSNLLTSLETRYESTDEKLKQLEKIHNDVFFDKTNEEGKIIKISLINSIEQQKSKLDTLINQANKKLYALTDSSLHNAFASRAKNYTTEFTRLEGITHKLTWAVIADILLFGLIQLILVLTDKGFNYHILIYQFSIAGALIFAIWMFNRNQKMAKKLAEEYHHKASIAEAMTGYRQLYELEHEDYEYMELFNALKDQLNINPSKSIDKFLNLKSPQEEISDKLKNTLDPDKLKDLAEKLKPLLN